MALSAKSIEQRADSDDLNKRAMLGDCLKIAEGCCKFWLEDGSAKYYHNSLYPGDIHCSAQGIVTCLKLREHDDRSVSIAKKIAKWAIGNMQDKEGYFYYQKTRWYTNKIPYMRWSQAWMFYALSACGC